MRRIRRVTGLSRALGSRWQARPVVVQDTALALLFLALAVTPGIARLGLALGELPERPFDVGAALLVLALAPPLAIRRLRPLLGLTTVATAFAVHESLGYPPTFAALALLVMLYSVGAHLERNRRLVAGGATVAYLALAVVLTERGSPERPFDFFTFYIVLAVSAAAGTRVRAGRIAEAERRRLAADAARAQERTVIARELHDVVTHHVTAMVVQADAAQFLLATPERAATGLSAVSGTGRRALSELRELLDLLDTADDGADPDRAPAVGRLSELVERTRSTGQTVELVEDGDHSALSGRVALAAYRVVQEALTNVAKHASGSPVSVRVHYTVEQVEISVENAGPPVPDAAPGRGLTGLRERVDLLGGSLAAAGRPSGGFAVRASIPVGEAS